VQRGRDHGIPPYNEWRQVCGYEKARTWNDFEEYMEPQVLLIKFQKLCVANSTIIYIF